ncbi:PTS sugar transporter subunit IIA [Amycolatopsis rhizosphaerae]|uniref:Mannitol-specific phosphotransferase enzyme IIA component n=1 Tax=Amycolatopsis rhizosphaerae TaxID=2053003 RepID=A0A558C7H7_9PSEU|nr:PTS sugar transporter subunit IIA [Amycolatopsis rhizosphaerae]TVT44745.1 PTS sugar transporter subunit IIA [Amycolatopsis rhizosphaerae]
MPTDAAILSAESVLIGCAAPGRDDAITQVGRKLLALGAVEPQYLDAMHDRERSVSTYVGEGVAIPHGTDESRRFVKRTALAVLQFPDGVDWDGNEVRLCVGIAAKGSEQVGILSSLARILMDGERARQLREAPDADTILRVLNEMDEEFPP